MRIPAALAATLALALGLGACSTTTFNCRDFGKGACDVSSTRFLTDTQAVVSVPGGGSVSVTSKPNDAATSRAFDAADKAIALATAAVGVATANPALVAGGALAATAPPAVAAPF